MATYTEMPSGKWRAQIRKPGFSTSRTFNKKADAARWADETERGFSEASTRGLRAPPKGATVGDLITKYIELMPNTWGFTKAGALKLMQQDPMGSVLLTKFNSATMNAFVDRMQKKSKTGISIGIHLSMLRGVFSWGREVRRLDIDPDLVLEARRGLKHRGLRTRGGKRSRMPTADELEKLYQYFRTRPKPQRCKNDHEQILKFALATTMRLGEICGLQIEDIDMERHTVVIRDRKDPKDKIGNNQTVPLLPDAWAIAMKLKGDRTEGQLFLGSNSKTASTGFQRAIKDCQIVGLRFHDSRRWAISSLVARGLSIAEVQLLSGHKDLSSLGIYLKASPEQVHSKFARIQEQ